MYIADIKQDTKLHRVRVVLVEPSHNGNIGAVARALKNMGIAQLAMVNPRHALDESAYARSGHGADILKNAQIYTTLDAAIADCSVVYATRSRDAKIKWPQLDARHCALDVHQQLSKLPENAQIAILFGPERTGLLNEHLEKSHYHVVIPTHPHYSSLNLAQAVQIIAYELYMAEIDRLCERGVESAPVTLVEYASQDAMEYFYQYMESNLAKNGFIVLKSAEKTMRRIRRIFQKAQLTPTELQLLTGAMKALNKNDDNT